MSVEPILGQNVRALTLNVRRSSFAEAVSQRRWTVRRPELKEWFLKIYNLPGLIALTECTWEQQTHIAADLGYHNSYGNGVLEINGKPDKKIESDRSGNNVAWIWDGKDWELLDQMTIASKTTLIRYAAVIKLRRRSSGIAAWFLVDHLTAGTRFGPARVGQVRSHLEQAKARGVDLERLVAMGDWNDSKVAPTKVATAAETPKLGVRAELARFGLIDIEAIVGDADFTGNGWETHHGWEKVTDTYTGRRAPKLDACLVGKLIKARYGQIIRTDVPGVDPTDHNGLLAGLTILKEKPNVSA